MKHIKASFILLLFIIAHAKCLASASTCEEECYIPNLYPHRPFVGPEIYHVHRQREGGTKQHGWLYGVRVGYDRVKRCAFYWGVDYLWAQGRLHGEIGSGDRLRSTFTDQNIEGRAGYTLQTQGPYHLSLTPFVGYGYFRETNKFHHESKIRSHNRFDYVAYGFLSSMAFCPCWTIGLNFKVRTPIDIRCKLSGIPDIGSGSQTIGERNHYRVELPIAYRFCPCFERAEFDLVPFYEYRHYGRREKTSR